MSVEEKVIGAAIANKEGHLLVSEDRELFSAYGDVYDFIKDYIERNNITPPMELVTDQLNLEIEVPKGSTDYWLHELKDEFVKIRVSQILTKASKNIKTMPGPEIVDKLVTNLSGLSKYGTPSKDVNMMDAAAALEHFASKRAEALANGGTVGITTGFKSIDLNYATGFAKGHFVVVMGYSGRMKSFLTDLLAVRAWEQGYKPMIVSLEMTPEEQRERLYPMMEPGKFKIGDMMKGEVDEDDFREWSNSKFANQKDFIIVSNEGTKDVTPNHLQSLYDKHKPDIIFYDYLQLGMDNAKTAQITPRMMNLSRELKLFAVRNNVPVVAITAVTDEENDKRDSPPMTSQISWSKAIEYDANLIMAVHKYHPENPDDAWVSIEVCGRKNRHGNLFNFYLKANVNEGIFKEEFLY